MINSSLHPATCLEERSRSDVPFSPNVLLFSLTWSVVNPWSGSTFHNLNNWRSDWVWGSDAILPYVLRVVASQDCFPIQSTIERKRGNQRRMQNAGRQLQFAQLSFFIVTFQLRTRNHPCWERSNNHRLRSVVCCGKLTLSLEDHACYSH